MKKQMLFVALTCAVAFGVFGGVLDRAWIQGKTDKNPLFYKPGEEMVFTLTPQNIAGELVAGDYFLDWSRTGDDGIVEKGRVPFTKAPFVYKTRLAKPGFVRVLATVVDKKGKAYSKVFFDGGAGVEIDSLTPYPEPKDFDAFWGRQFRRLDLVAIKPELKELPCRNKNARLYAVQVPCAGLRSVTGYLSVPKAVDCGVTFPARLETHGYSGDRCVHAAPNSARDNEIVLNINAHGLKLPAFGATDADTKALRWEIRSHDMSYAFDPAQNADPEVAYFNGMVLRVKRALQYLKTVKGWNGKDLIASGGSQGGLQTIWAAGCGEGVTRAESCITWCCDLYTSGKLRKDPAQKLAGDGWYIAWTDAMGYFDAVNFSKRIPATCTTIITRAGLGDYCCPPTGLAKLWNSMTCPKKIFWVQGSRHGYVPKAYDGRDFIREAPAAACKR